MCVDTFNGSATASCKQTLTFFFTDNISEHNRQAAVINKDFILKSNLKTLQKANNGEIRCFKTYNHKSEENCVQYVQNDILQTQKINITCQFNLSLQWDRKASLKTC